MLLSSADFLSLDNPPSLGCSPLPTSYSVPNELEWIYRLQPTPQTVLSPAELEEANKFVDAVLADGDGESEAKFDPTFKQAAAAAAESGEGLAIAPMQVAEDGMVAERPKNLPRDWYVIEKTRKLGKTAGQKDKYYIQKNTGRILRSLKRVRRFVETGSATIRKPRKQVVKGNSGVSDDKSKGKRPVEEGEGGEVERQMPTSVLP